MIDETHNILAATYNDQRAMLNPLRFISNELRVSIVCFGVSDAKEGISGDVQLARRFQEFDLPRWKVDEKFQAGDRHPAEDDDLEIRDARARIGRSVICR